MPLAEFRLWFPFKMSTLWSFSSVVHTSSVLHPLCLRVNEEVWPRRMWVRINNSRRNNNNNSNNNDIIISDIYSLLTLCWSQQRPVLRCERYKRRKDKLWVLQNKHADGELWPPFMACACVCVCVLDCGLSSPLAPSTQPEGEETWEVGKGLWSRLRWAAWGGWSPGDSVPPTTYSGSLVVS